MTRKHNFNYLMTNKNEASPEYIPWKFSNTRLVFVHQKSLNLEEKSLFCIMKKEGTKEAAVHKPLVDQFWTWTWQSCKEINKYKQIYKPCKQNEYVSLRTLSTRLLILLYMVTWKSNSSLTNSPIRTLKLSHQALEPKIQRLYEGKPNQHCSES